LAAGAFLAATFLAAGAAFFATAFFAAGAFFTAAFLAGALAAGFFLAAVAMGNSFKIGYRTIEIEQPDRPDPTMQLHRQTNRASDSSARHPTAVAR
jgi:predicted phage tail protein